MEGAGPGQRVGQHARVVAQHLAADALDTAAHLVGGAAGKGHQQDATRIGAVEDQVRDPVGQRIGLAGARAGDDQQRPVRGCAFRSRCRARRRFAAGRSVPRGVLRSSASDIPARSLIRFARHCPIWQERVNLTNVKRRGCAGIIVPAKPVTATTGDYRHTPHFGQNSAQFEGEIDGSWLALARQEFPLVKDMTLIISLLFQ